MHLFKHRVVGAALLLGTLSTIAAAQSAPTTKVSIGKDEILQSVGKGDIMKQPGQSRPAAGVMCTMEARPALMVTLQDENGIPLSSLQGARVIARMGLYADTSAVLPASGMSSFSLAHERAGRFEVEVSAPGYAMSVLTGVTVEKTADGCHVVTRQLTARMHR